MASCSKDLDIIDQLLFCFWHGDLVHTIHTARFGGLFSDGGSHVAGNLSDVLWIAAPGERLWLAVSKSMEER